MKDRLLPTIFVWAIVALCGGQRVLADNHAPVVSNIIASERQDSSKLVDIYYNLGDGDGDACFVSLIGSNDGGQSWNIIMPNVSGDVGSAIPPGVSKHIVWNCGTDLPGWFGQFRVRVFATDNQGTSMLLVPAGEFAMGSGGGDASPIHSVYTSAFWIDRFEVTNQQYLEGLNWALQQGLVYVTLGVVYGAANDLAYCDTTQSSSFSRITWTGSTFGITAGKESHPMVMVSWYGAAAYANWRSAMQGRPLSYDTSTWECNFAAHGYRLPTEAEREKAARGGHYAPSWLYPWGDSLTANVANYATSGDPYECGSGPSTTPVGFYIGQLQQKADFNWPCSPTSYQTANGMNGYGLYDMGGNVWDRCNDWYSATYYSSSPYDNPRGPTSGTYRVIRGGSFDNGTNCLPCAFRMYDTPAGRYYSYGFRLALDSE
jgi:formylglycine-generating enzyme required for sulfatase activity